MHDYELIWQSTGKLPWCALVTTGRTGSDLFQSLLDGHPEIYGFNGHIFHYEFWEHAYTTQASSKLILEDILDEFIGHFIAKLKSRYDLEERKNELGEERNQSVDVNIPEFRHHMTALLGHGRLCSKDFLRAVFLSWGLCLKHDVSQKKLFFHHIHQFEELQRYLVDYPKSKVVSMTRDPRASYVSGVESWRAYNPTTDHGEHVLGVLKRTIIDATPLTGFGLDFRVIRLEDLGKRTTLDQFCEWLDISYDDCMQRATFGGLRWWADRLSKDKIGNDEVGYSPALTKNNWENKLGFVEKEVLNYLLRDRLQWYGYKYCPRPEIPSAILMVFAILVPSGYERRFFSWTYLRKTIQLRKPRWIFASFYGYMARVLFFYRLLIPRWRGDRFRLPYIGMAYD